MTTRVHLVGSINLPDVRSTYLAVAGALGDRLTRMPDGEVGERFYWIQFQKDFFDQTPGLSRVGPEREFLRDVFDPRPFRIDPGVDPASIELPALGYSDAAMRAFVELASMQRRGEVPHGIRLQIALPTPASVVGSFFVPEDRAAIEPIYEKALLRELWIILRNLPHDRIAIQWDTALEFAMLDEAEIRGNRITSWFGDTHDEILAGVVERAARQAAAVPLDVEVGYHLCYGDVEEHHFTEPTDAGRLAEVLNGLFSAAPRPITWVHLPVPIERDDVDYFAPLAGVEWPQATEIYLGLLHHEDGLEGASRRAFAASTVVPSFGVATECGFGRGPSGRTDSLLELHEAAAAALDR